jgi:hypothetical protein
VKRVEREIISRTAMLVLGATLLCAGAGVLYVACTMAPSRHLFYIGGGLCVAGGWFLYCVFLPSKPGSDEGWSSLKYVVLQHNGVAEPHFDLMCEIRPGSMLKTWRLPCWPVERAAIATAVDDHRRDYLTLEGPVSGDRGSVKRVACGSCIVEEIDKAQWQITFDEEPPTRVLNLKQIAGPEWRAQIDRE